MGGKEEGKEPVIGRYTTAGLPRPIISSLLSWPVPLAQVLPRPQLIFPSETWFFGICLNFQQQKSLRNQYLPHSESKSYQINSIKSLLIKIFPTTRRHIPIPLKFSATI